MEIVEATNIAQTYIYSALVIDVCTLCIPQYWLKNCKQVLYLLVSPTYIIASALFAIVLTPLLLRVAAWRTLRQPLICYPEHEKSILASVGANPSYAALILDLKPEHFVDSARALLWDEIKHYCLTLVTHTDDSTHELVLDNKNTLSKVEPELLLAALSAEAALVLRDEWESVDEDKFLERSKLVYASGVDRDYYGGKCIIEKTNKPSIPLVRLVVGTSLMHAILTFTMLAAGAVASISTSHYMYSGRSALLLSCGMLTLLMGSVIWSIVDLNTLYVDVPSLLLFGGLAWGFTIWGSLLADAAVNIYIGIGASLFVGVFIFLVSLAHMRIRGKPGMGGGDYMLMLATIGVPVAVTGIALMANWILLVSLCMGILGWVFKYTRSDNFNKNTPYAFGPYLACGWFVTLGLWRLLQ